MANLTKSDPGLMTGRSLFVLVLKFSSATLTLNKMYFPFVFPTFVLNQRIVIPSFDVLRTHRNSIGTLL